MKRRQAMIVGAIALVAVFTIAYFAWAPRPSDRSVISGYVEGDDLYLSAPVAGSLGQVFVTKGQRVEAGAPLFSMDASTLAAQQGQAQARVAQSQAQIAAAQAQAQQAQAAVAAARAVEANAQKDYARLTGLQRSNPAAVAGQQVDQARAAAANAAAQRQAAEQAASAQALQVSAARAAAAQAGAQLGEAGVRVGQLAQRAPSAGRIEEVFYQAGEWAAPNQPVVSLLPDAQVKLRLFVPERDVALYRPGTVLRFSCDGCAKGLTARVTAVSPRPEYTPPVIYSRNMRDKLVFMVEAAPDAPARLQPGLPVDVEPLTGTRR